MTINGLRSTIRYDEDVFRWAISLLEINNVYNTLSKSKIYAFRTLHFSIMAINLAAVFLVFKILMSSPRPVDFLLILAIAAGVYLLELPYKNLTALLVTEFIKAKFPDQELENRTLLQLGVQLENKFGAGAVLDVLGGWIKVFRMALLLAYIAISRFPLFLCGAWTLRSISRSTMLTSFFKAFS